MDLALELGMTVEALSDSMSESELGQWQAYARKRWLPGRRLELLLANIARVGAGGDSLAPFVFDPALREAITPKAAATAMQAGNAFAAIAGSGRIIRLGSKRKKVAHG